MLFKVFKGEYPFNEQLTTIECATAEQASMAACKLYPGAVVEPADGVQPLPSPATQAGDAFDGGLVLSDDWVE
jgi:hypothetical protein